MCKSSANILRMVNLLSCVKILPINRNMCGLHCDKSMDNSSFRLVSKPVLHSWEDIIMENKAYVHRKAIHQHNRRFLTRLIKKLNPNELPRKELFCVLPTIQVLAGLRNLTLVLTNCNLPIFIQSG